MKDHPQQRLSYLQFLKLHNEDRREVSHKIAIKCNMHLRMQNLINHLIHIIQGGNLYDLRTDFLQ